MNICLKDKQTPLYFFDKTGFVENYHELENTFKEIYPNYRVSYSYKTNYTPYICKTVKELGGYAEVVSDMEYTLAKKLGYRNDQIVYNGPAKGELLEEHLLNHGIVNVDNLGEMQRICDICDKHKDVAIEVGLRINIDVGGSFISRFGFEFDGEDYRKAIQLVDEQENLKIVGIHCHISRARGLDAWQKRSYFMLAVADSLFVNPPKYISLGSGMFGKMSDALLAQFGDCIPTYKDYADAVFKVFAERYKNETKKPIVFTEPGTTLIAKYVSFVTRVLDMKTIRGRTIVTVDGSFENLGEICSLKKLPFEVISCGGKNVSVKNADIMGYTCLEQDVMYDNFCGDLAIGDILVFENVGGYSIVSKPQFIQPNCAMYAIDFDKTEIEILRKETFEDVFAKFKF